MQADFWVQSQTGLQSEFQASQSYTEKPCPKNQNKKQKNKNKNKKTQKQNKKTKKHPPKKKK